MCLGIPGKIIDIYTQNELLMGKIDFGGVIREACLTYVPEAKIGDYAVVHVGFALNLLDEAEARETLKAFDEVDLFSQVGDPFASLADSEDSAL